MMVEPSKMKFQQYHSHIRYWGELCWPLQHVNIHGEACDLEEGPHLAMNAP